MNLQTMRSAAKACSMCTRKHYISPHWQSIQGTDSTCLTPLFINTASKTCRANTVVPNVKGIFHVYYYTVLVVIEISFKHFCIFFVFGWGGGGKCTKPNNKTLQ